MKKTGIIMSGDHPAKILDGTKTMTRRVIVPQPMIIDEIFNRPIVAWYRGKQYCSPYLDTLPEFCPYGQVGDRLWVRETWAAEKRLDHLNGTQLGEAGYVALWFKATEIPIVSLVRGRWRSSRFMPRWASRITLEITDIRVERLQEISREDIRAEGIGLPPSPRFTPTKFSELHQEFAALWDSLNAKRGYGWEVNPWVWVISFKLVV